MKRTTDHSIDVCQKRAKIDKSRFPLCHECSAIDLTRLIFEDSSLRPQGADLGVISSRFASEDTCGLCFLICQIFRSTYRENGLPSDLEQTECSLTTLKIWRSHWDEKEYANGKIDSICRDDFNSPPEPQFLGHRTACIRLDTYPVGQKRNATYHSIRIMPFAHKSLKTGNARFCQRWMSSIVDFEKIKQWHSLCTTVHGERCANPKWLQRKQPKNLRLVDVYTRSVVEAPVGCQYAALSYVWGEQTQTVAFESYFQRSPFRLPQDKPLSKTIEHAIQITIGVGLRYLWVDALCIAQYPLQNQHKTFHLKQMGEIFKSAELTLIAATGRNCDSGIAGITERPIVNHIVDLDNVSLALNHDSLHASRPDSMKDEDYVWPQRAWTFQEEKLSRRAVAFDQHEMFWICQCDRWRESIVLEPSEDDVPGKQHRLLPDTSNPPLDVLSLNTYEWNPEHKIVSTNNVLQAYLTLVIQISQRRIADPHDRLFAIDGLFQLAAARDPARWTTMYNGMPKAYFDIAMLWIADVPMYRAFDDSDERGCPTWSWAGWHSPIGSAVRWDTSEYEGSDVSVSSGVHWYIITNDRSWIPIKRCVLADPKLYTDVEFPPSGIQAARLDVPPPGLGDEHHVPYEYCFISCLTTSAFAQFGRKLPKRASEKHPPDSPDPWTLVDSSGKFVGSAFVHSSKVSAYARTSIKFIYLSRGQYWNNSVRWFFPPANPSLGIPPELNTRDEQNIINVMAIEGAETGVARRLFVAKVLEERWLALQPQTEWIVLG